MNCEICGTQTGGGLFCYEHQPYMIFPQKDGSFISDRGGRKRVWLEEPPNIVERNEEITRLRAENEALKKERDELAAKCAAMVDACSQWASYAECVEINTALPARAKALLECVEKAKAVNESFKNAGWRGAALIELDKALAGLE